MKPSRLETTCSVTVDLIALDMFPPDEAGGDHAVPRPHPSPGITYRLPLIESTSRKTAQHIRGIWMALPSPMSLHVHIDRKVSIGRQCTRFRFGFPARGGAGPDVFASNAGAERDRGPVVNCADWLKLVAIVYGFGTSAHVTRRRARRNTRGGANFPQRRGSKYTLCFQLCANV